MNDDLYEYLGQWFEWDRMKAAQNAIKHRVRFTRLPPFFLTKVRNSILIQTTP